MVWLLAIALIAGITRCASAGVFVACAGAAWSLATGAPRRHAAAIGLLGLACAFHGAAAMSAMDARRAWFTSAFSARDAVMLRGIVAGYPRATRHGSTFRLDTTIGGVRVPLLVRAARFDLHPGDSLAVVARATTGSRPVQSLYADGVVGTVSVRAGDTTVLAAGPARPGWRLHRRARIVLTRRLGSGAALPLALLAGERGLIGTGMRDAFARLGVAHLLALSGMHLGLAAGALWLLCRLGRVPSRHAPWVVAALLVCYVGAVGDLHSLTRALAMALVVVVAKMSQRPVDAVAVLGRALFVLLLVRPASLYSVGFQLSFTATFAVVTAVRWIPRGNQRGRLRRILHGAMATALSGAAVLVVIAPLQLHYFGTMSLAGPVATVVLLPVVAAILGLAAAAVAAASGPGIGAAAFRLLEYLCDGTAAIVTAMAGVAPAPLSAAPPDGVVYGAGIAFVLLSRRCRSLGPAGIMLLCAAFAKSWGM